MVKNNAMSCLKKSSFQHTAILYMVRIILYFWLEPVRPFNDAWGKDPAAGW